MTPEEAVRSLVDYQSIDNGHLEPFEPSGVYDPSLAPFRRPGRRRRLAAETGERWASR